MTWLLLVRLTTVTVFWGWMPRLCLAVTSMLFDTTDPRGLLDGKAVDTLPVFDCLF